MTANPTLEFAAQDEGAPRSLQDQNALDKLGLPGPMDVSDPSDQPACPNGWPAHPGDNAAATVQGHADAFPRHALGRSSQDAERLALVDLDARIRACFVPGLRRTPATGL